MKIKLLLLCMTLQACSCSNDKIVAITDPPPTPCIAQAEVCDGVDNDCDSHVDEDTNERCSTQCGVGFSRCVRGRMVECDAPLPTAEVCNNRDDDCDGIVDNEDSIGIKPCYPGNKNDLLNGECRFGVERCVYGVVACRNFVSPVTEMCNGKDDDCDGQVDEGIAKSIDIVFALDYSGSMFEKIGNLASVTSQWASKYSSRSDMRIALVGIPDDTGVPGVNVMRNFSTPREFADTLSMHVVANGGGSEPSIDVILFVSDPSNPLGLNWSNGAKKVLIVYTDEPPQSYTYPPTDEQTAKTLASASNVDVHVFTDLSISWWRWSPYPFSASHVLETTLDMIVSQGSCQ